GSRGAGNPAVASVFTTVGWRGEPNRGRLQVELTRDRPLTTPEVQAQLRAALPQLDGVTISVEDVQFIEIGDEKPLQIGLLGEDAGELSEIAQAVQAAITTEPGFADVTATGADNLEGEIQAIQHLNGQRVAYVEANLTPGQGLGDATARVVAEIAAIAPADITIDLGGDSVRSNQVLRSFGRTLSLSVACMLLFLILPFGRLLEPLVVGLCLPLSLAGALLALLFTGSEFGTISLLGLLFLLGLLDKNALLLMDYINQLRHSGCERTDAILQTGLVRLRPILMTTASTVLGMLPIALGLGAGAELRQPMAVAIIGGLLASSALSLLVVPVLYTLLEDGWQRLRGKPAKI
ncbi:MAG: efflux RND transporter permease subunit, partial [Spirulinaceae cyanobacterium RM2_2_10]|nr:efflux RND transporter permease subunit [Spirulinaceae cyanobacterium RM2_2_10]